MVRCYFDIVDGALALKDTRVQRGSCIPLGLPLDKNLIPILDFAEMEKRAEGILKRFYPKSMKFFMVVDPSSLARHYGLATLRMRIDPDNGVLGKLYFTQTRILHYRGTEVIGFQMVQPGTIVINRDPDEPLPQEVERFTIAHECAHWVLHRWAFLYFLSAGITETEEACRRCTPVSSEPKDILLDRIERQANGLAARILMPAWSTLAYANMAPPKELYSKPRYRAELAVNKVAHGLRVSKQAAKIRLMELRFADAALAYPNLEKLDMTNEISPEDAIELYAKSESLRKVLSTGRFVYVQDKFVQADPKYLSRNEDGSLKVIEENPCACLRFRYTRKASYTIEGALRAYVFEAGYIPEEEMDIKMLDQQVTHINNVIHMLPQGFGDTLVWYMKRKNLTAEKLAERSNLSEKTIQRCRNIKDERIPFNTAIALCVGLQLPGLLGRDLLHKAGHTLRNTKTDMVYRAVLDFMTRNRIDEVDRFLEGMRLKPLTRTKDE